MLWNWSVIGNRRGRWTFRNWGDIGLSPASRETTQTNKPPKHYTTLHCISIYLSSWRLCASKTIIHWLLCTTLSRCLTMHLNNGGPLQHAATVHNQKLTGAHLVDNTKILYHESNFKKLTILDALAIKNLNPSINSQCIWSDCTLQLFH